MRWAAKEQVHVRAIRKDKKKTVETLMTADQGTYILAGHLFSL
jgi:hypothetical protein